MMNKSAVIIFVRNPVPGKVKTRLALTMGNEKALLIYKELLQHSCSITQHLACDKFIFYADYINEQDIWDNNTYHKRMQRGEDLGARMRNAFLDLFKRGYAKVVLIGSDCVELSEVKIEEAFEKLESGKIIIGPASDGGYYLLGLTEMVIPIFQNIYWSTSNVLSDTLNTLNRMGYPYFLLPVLNDIDEENDLPEELKIKASIHQSQTQTYKNNR